MYMIMICERCWIGVAAFTLILSCVPMLSVTRRRTLFSDPSNEIQELTQVIKQDLAKLNSDIADLQQQVKSRSGRENKHVRTHSSSVVVSLQVDRYIAAMFRVCPFYA